MTIRFAPSYVQRLVDFRVYLSRSSRQPYHDACLILYLQLAYKKEKLNFVLCVTVNNNCFGAFRLVSDPKLSFLFIQRWPSHVQVVCPAIRFLETSPPTPEPLNKVTGKEPTPSVRGGQLGEVNIACFMFCGSK